VSARIPYSIGDDIFKLHPDQSLVEWRRLKVLIIGGLGFIGKYVIRILTGTHELVVFSDPETAERKRSFAETHQVRIITGSITDAEKLKDVFDAEAPDAVIHLAALTGLTKCNESPSLAFSTNVFGTYNVIMGCVASKAKLIFVSSREVYGESKESQTAENAPLLPNNVYGVTKMLGEGLILWTAAKYGLEHTILRLTNVYGPEGDQYNIQAMIQTAMSKGVIPIMGGGQRMNFVYVEDVAEVIRRCLTDPNASHETFNVGSKDDLTVEEVVTQLISMLNMPVRIEKKPMRSGETLSFRPNLEKIESRLEYTARTTFTDGLRRTIDWYRTRTHTP